MLIMTIHNQTAHSKNALHLISTRTPDLHWAEPIGGGNLNIGETPLFETFLVVFAVVQKRQRQISCHDRLIKYYYYMSSFIPSQNVIGQVFSIAGLALVAPSCYFFRNYSRVLDYVQMFYVFALAFAYSSGAFSLNLQWGFIQFMSTFMNSYCNTGEFLCTYGYLISPGISWFGVTFLMLILLGILGCMKKNVRFQNFYNFWKGFMRWFMVPLAYYCTIQIIKSLQAANFSITDASFDWAIGVAVILFVWMFVELIGYKCAQREEENNWRKWCDFFSNFRIAAVVAIAAVSGMIDPMAKYFIYGPIVIYDLVFLVKYKFTFRIFERLIFIIQQGVLITVFSLFIFKVSYLTDNNIDLLGLLLVIFLEIVLFLPKLVSYCRSGDDNDDSQVNPEGDKKTPVKRNDIMDDISPEPSRMNLNNSSGVNSPPRQAPKKR